MDLKTSVVQSEFDNQYAHYFSEFGFVHLPSCISQCTVSMLKNLFEKRIKICQEPLLRQRTATFSPHKFTSGGFMENALLDVHRHDIFHCANFVERVIEVLANKNLQNILAQVIPSRFNLVQTMYFESSKGTPEHFDKLFFSPQKGVPFIGVWIALEDIRSDAGAFYVYPKSHDHDFAGNENADQLKELIKEYFNNAQRAMMEPGYRCSKSQLKAVIKNKRILKTIIRKAGWERYYPTFKAGDVLLFDNTMLHGSDIPQNKLFSRNSLTAHFIGSEATKIWYGTVEEKIVPKLYKDISYHISRRYTFRQNLSEELACAT